MDNETFLDEKVQVLTVFEKSIYKCRPIRFKRTNGQVVEISEIGLRHPVPSGRKTLHIYDVTDGQSEYRLEFDSESLLWRLTREAVYEQY